MESGENTTRMGLIKEDLLNFLRSTPPEGIAIHVTSASAAKEIVELGFDSQGLYNQPNNYIAFRPGKNINLYHILHNARMLITYAYDWGYQKSIKEGDPSPTVIVFRPPEKTTSGEEAQIKREDHLDKIPNDRIIGTFKIERGENNSSTLTNKQLREVMTKIRQTVTKNGI